jgi:acetyl-CoA carboxylase biotin carboxylase subunit
MLKRVLIANRGEIALRIIRACRAMGIGTVAVYSEPDAEAPHVAAADRAVLIGPAPARASYLNIPAIVDAARRTKADAIHPGYGFLSENASFARACEDSGITFIGPPSQVIARMGSKPSARETMRAAGVPVVPGALPGGQGDSDLASAAATVGFPLLLKAASGGGGKGMRVVRAADELAEAIGAARREAERAFGNGALYIERLVEQARHVEVQIFADSHGSIVHLFERDCSLQRRHQKVIEESPGPTVAAGVRDRMTRAAIEAARAVGYVNAGTVEFLLRGHGESAEFYFLEMNTRLQVEHGVTEAVTGLDLVQTQLAVAAGERLPFEQADVRLEGHAVECRVYAEDSARLLPQSGRLLRYREPSSPGIRIDSGVREGQTVTAHYDPMLAKLIAHEKTRAAALDSAAMSLRAFEILGLRHNIAFLLALLARPEVRNCETNTRFIDDHLQELASQPSVEALVAAAAVAARTAGRAPVASARAADATGHDPWQTIGPITW